MPNLHASAVVVQTLFWVNKSCISGDFHEVALFGCSWRKYFPRDICQR
jgi:hypothetical protein